VGSADVMQLMMVTQYLDMMKDVGTRGDAEALFMPRSNGSIEDMMRQGALRFRHLALGTYL
jgi:hypothetical protein